MADGQEVESENSDKTMADTIAETWRKINERPESDEVPVETKAEETPAKPRDETGKFAKAEEKPEEVKDEEPKPKKTFIPKWKKEALEKWTTLDPVIQQSVEQREQDFHKGLEGYKTDAEFGKSFKEALKPFEANYAAHGLSAHEAAAHLFNVENILRRGTPQQKLGVISQLAQDYQIPIAALFGQQGQQQAPQVPAADPALYQRITAVEQMLNQKEAEIRAQQEAQLQGQIQKAAENREHFELLRPTMAGLLQSGTASDLESAYDMAMQLHPVTKPIWVAEQQTKWRQESAAKAEAARKSAGVNLRPKGFVPSGEAVGSMKDTIANRARELGLI